MNEVTIFIFGILVCNIFVLGAYDHIKNLLQMMNNNLKYKEFMKEIEKENTLHNRGVANFEPQTTSNDKQYYNVIYK